MAVHIPEVPPLCSACGRSCRAGAVICTRCARQLNSADPVLGTGPAGLDRVWSSAPDEGVARDLLAALRFRHLRPVAELMAERIAWLAPSHMLSGTVVPVPGARRQRLRKALQPGREIAECLAERLDSPLLPCLERPSVSLAERVRTRQARPERCVVRAIGAAPRSVLLIDDVLGTGESLTACARALRAAGASRVVAVTFARRL